jgi:hypothetical protein
MLIDAVQRFVTLSKQYGIKGSDPLVKEIMTTLRRSGFSSHQISELSGWKWSSTLVRQYTRDWNGVDEELDTQRKTLLTPLRELVSSNISLNDIKKNLRLEKSVKAKGSSIEEVAELNSILKVLDLHSREVMRLVSISRTLLEQNLNPNTVQYWITLDQELIEDGFNKEARMRLSKLCDKFGGVHETLNAVMWYNDLNSILTHRIQLLNEVEKLRGDKYQLDLYIYENRELVNASRNAMVAGFDAASLALISVLATDLGGPYKVVDALKIYKSMNEVNQDLIDMRTVLDKVKRESIDKKMLLNALTYTLVETEEAYVRNSDVRQVVNLLVNPRDLRMDKDEVVGLLTRVLDKSFMMLGRQNKFVNPPDPIWNDTVISIKVLSDRLRQFIKIQE